MLKAKIESHTPREIIKARDATAKTLQEVETGWRRAQDVIGQRAGPTKVPMGLGPTPLMQMQLDYGAAEQRKVGKGGKLVSASSTCAGVFPPFSPAMRRAPRFFGVSVARLSKGGDGQWLAALLSRRDALI